LDRSKEIRRGRKIKGDSGLVSSKRLADPKLIRGAPKHIHKSHGGNEERRVQIGLEKKKTFEILDEKRITQLPGGKSTTK